MYINKNKGTITAFIIIVISFITWTIFSSSFLLSGELSIIKDRKIITENSKEEIVLEIFFNKIIQDIEKEISEKNIKDIIYYFAEKDGKLIWQRNYSSFVKSDREYAVNTIKAGDNILEISENSRDFSFKTFIETNVRNSIKHTESVVISFSKTWENIYIDGENETYNIKMRCDILAKYVVYSGADVEEMGSCEINGIEFEIY